MTGKLFLTLAAFGAVAVVTAACSGDDGATGATGSIGQIGAQGVAGSVGAQGEIGPAGDTGAVGPAGTQGVAGPAGADGAAGEAGLTGLKGDAGPAGADGLDWPGTVPAALNAADAIAGGAAYSKWWVTAADGTGLQPAGPRSDFIRCKSCHAWDGNGNQASYADRTGQSTGTAKRPDVSSVDLRAAALRETPSELFDLIMRPAGRPLLQESNAHPAYAGEGGLTADQAWNIVKFMKEEWVEPTALYDLAVTGEQMSWDYSTTPRTLIKPTLTFSSVGAEGDATNGAAVFAQSCTECHGADGTEIDIGGRSLGQFIREKPHEAWFKAKFGEPGTGMNPGLLTVLSDLQDLYAALADETNFPNP